MTAPYQANDNLAALKREARCCIAIAKLAEFDHQCQVFGAQHVPDERRPEVVDFLHEVAFANGLLRIHGHELVEGLIADGLGERGAA